MPLGNGSTVPLGQKAADWQEFRASLWAIGVFEGDTERARVVTGAVSSRASDRPARD
jgi:hypothetical protein